MRALAIDATGLDGGALLNDWAWQVPTDHKLLLIGAFGDCILGDPSGGHWNLSLLEGDYGRIAASSAEFNAIKNDRENLQFWFNAEWVEVATASGLEPTERECLGWNIHPALGGPFELGNIGVFSLKMYLSVTGQLFRQIKMGA